MKNKKTLQVVVNQTKTLNISKGLAWTNNSSISFIKGEKLNIEVGWKSNFSYLKVVRNEEDFPLDYLRDNGIISEDEFNSFGICTLHAASVVKNRGSVLREIENEKIAVINYLYRSGEIKIITLLEGNSINEGFNNLFHMDTIKNELELQLPYSKGETLPRFFVTPVDRIFIGI